MKTLIVTGGSIDIDFLKEHLKSNSYDLIIAVDKGLESLDKIRLNPDYIIGDFDSINKEILAKYNKNIITLNKEKDYTDTHMALKLALEHKSTHIVIIGAIGTRLDHTIANVHILKEALEQNVKCELLNKNNKVFLINSKTDIEKDENFKYLSIIPLTERVTGVTLSGLKYSLKNATLTIGASIRSK